MRFCPPPQTILLDPPLRQSHAAVDLTTHLAGCFCPRSACALAFGVVHHFSILVSCINVIARPVPVSCRVVRVGPVTCPQVAARASSARHWQIDVSRISIRTIIIVAFGVQRQYWRSTKGYGVPRYVCLPLAGRAGQLTTRCLPGLSKLVIAVTQSSYPLQRR